MEKHHFRGFSVQDGKKKKKKQKPGFRKGEGDKKKGLTAPLPNFVTGGGAHSPPKTGDAKEKGGPRIKGGKGRENFRRDFTYHGGKIEGGFVKKRV